MLRQALLWRRNCINVLHGRAPAAVLLRRRCSSSRVYAMSATPLNVQGPGADKLRAAGCEGACSRDTPRVEPAELQEHLRALPAWQLNPEQTMISRTFTAKNFMAAIRFFNRVAEVAEAEGHHPDLHLRNFREVEVNLSTHAVGGLTLPDLVLAAKLDTLEVEYSPKWAKQEAERMAALMESQGGETAAARESV